MNTTVTLDLKADGTFVQTIQRSGQANPQVHKGAWALEGARPKLSVLKPVFGQDDKPWVIEEVNWWVMDSTMNEDTEFSICGAADDRDPDSCFEMKKLR